MDRHEDMRSIDHKFESDEDLIKALLEDRISLFGESLTERLRNMQALLLRLWDKMAALEANRTTEV